MPKLERHVTTDSPLFNRPQLRPDAPEASFGFERSIVGTNPFRFRRHPCGRTPRVAPRLALALPSVGVGLGLSALTRVTDPDRPAGPLGSARRQEGIDMLVHEIRTIGSGA